MRTLRKRHLAVTGGILAGLLGTAAWANWYEISHALSLTSAEQLQPVQVVSMEITNQPMRPGRHNGLRVVVHNPNAFPVTVRRIAVDGQITVRPGHPTCVKTGIATVLPYFPNRGVAANGDATITGANLITMSHASDNGCQGASFHFPLRVRATAD